MKHTTTNLTKLTAIAALAAGVVSSQGQLLYSEDFDTDQNASGNWVTNAAGNSPADLYFDYSTVGIPSAPNSTGGSTRGAKLIANLDLGGGLGTFPAGVSVSPINFSLPTDGNFEIHCDVWLNFNGPAPGGGSGSTQLGGIGFGTAGLTPQIIGSADSFFAITDGEGGSGSDYRVYTAAVPSSLQVGSEVYVAGSRNNSATYYVTNFPGGVTAPPAQTNLYPQQTGATAAGSVGWAWHDVSILKIGPFATWSIDGVPIAVVDTTTNGTGGTSIYGGDRLLFTQSDINSTINTEATAADLLFALFDNLRVSNVLANVVTMNVPSTQADEAFGTPATFTFTRTITGSSLTVNYTIGGLAENGVDYTNQLGGALTGSITFGPSDSSVNLNVIAINDTISEPEEDIIITVANGVGYVAAGTGTATILDNDAPLLILSADSTSMYERHTNDYCSVIVTRWGDPNAFLQIETTNFTFGGDAVEGVDFVLDTNAFPLFIFGGTTTFTNFVTPLDNGSYTGDRTFTVGLAPGAGFGVSNITATCTIRDDDNPPATVLYSNALTSAADASNWKLAFDNGNLLTLGPDFEASFGYDLSTDLSGGGTVAPPPGGANNALRTTVNNVVGANAGLNLYMTNQSFSGDYAVRFNMNVTFRIGGGTTQGPIFGINHSGDNTNWWAASSSFPDGGPWTSDGLWYWITADGGAGAGDYILHVGTGIPDANPNNSWTAPAVINYPNFTKLFKGNSLDPRPYSNPVGPGFISNQSSIAGGPTTTWTDVEIKQAGNVVTLYMNKVEVLRYANPSAFTSGYLMLGYADPFSSLGGPEAAAYYANLSVVRLDPLEITNITRGASDVTIDFTSNDGSASYALEGAPAVDGPYTAVPGANIVYLGGVNYTATAPATAGEQYYRIAK